MHTVAYVSLDGNSDVKIENKDSKPWDLSGTPCALDSNQKFRFNIKSDKKRETYFRDIISNYDVLLATSGPVLSLLTFCSVLSSYLLYKPFQSDLVRRVYLKM